MLVLCELCLYANFGSKILESFAYFVASTNFGNPVDLYVPVVLASASHPIGDWLLLLWSSCCTLHRESNVYQLFVLPSPSTMASNERLTRNSSQQADCQEVPSSVYFERWENRQASRDHLFLGKTAGTGRTRSNVLTCWEVNMGFVVRSPIPTDFNDVDS